MKPAALLILLFFSCPACLMADNAALAARAREQVGVTVSYNGGYQSIPYPNGDVPLETGVLHGCGHPRHEGLRPGPSKSRA